MNAKYTFQLLKYDCMYDKGAEMGSNLMETSLERGIADKSKHQT